MIEQSLQSDDIHSHAKLQAEISTAICLDGCITMPDMPAPRSSDVHAASLTLSWGASEAILVLAGYMMCAGTTLCQFGVEAPVGPAPAWTTEPELSCHLSCPSNMPGHSHAGSQRCDKADCSVGYDGELQAVDGGGRAGSHR
jgi:hypothetical protein